ncbi:hypothetical protein [Rhodovulum marinum]|uniref:Uncharacterized protein n=1 Tax=Rhodovulum marinum TaxID=320662 RepID=A0A4R2Q5N8_9RHOB|nr:hypothetical protein [Rhodovulum marinum]TCP43947.1 hypothetical protein EV662_10130 [Rhodovulum marinum]
MSAAHKLTPAAEALTALIYKAQMQARTLRLAGQGAADLSPEEFCEMVGAAASILEDILADATAHSDTLCADIFATHPAVRAARRAQERAGA